MPTRIALKNPHTAENDRSQKSRQQPMAAAGALDYIHPPLQSPRSLVKPENEFHAATPVRTPSSVPKSSVRQSSVFHRSTILRERIASERTRDLHDSASAPEPATPELIMEEDDRNVRLSSNDIRASPRLLGYMFCSVAAGVMFVSVIQFYRTQNELDFLETIRNPGQESKYVLIGTSTEFVFRYKLLGAFFLSAIGCFLNLVTVLVHFDTICFPRVWNRIFCDGSLWEGVWISLLVLFWAVNLHICTSSFSVGQVQANVFFTAWLAFIAVVSCLESWRELALASAVRSKSSGAASRSRPSPLAVPQRLLLSQWAFRLLDRPHRRETTTNWIWTGVCSTVLAGAVSDLYYNRSAIEFLYQGSKLIIDDESWTIILSAVWAEVALCFMSVGLNEWLYKPYRLPCRCRRKNQVYQCVYGWRQIEGLLMTLTLGGKFYVLLVYSGVDGPINGLSNAYFGLWGSFFNGSFLLGTWMRENKKISFIVREDDHEDDDEDAELNAAFDYDYN